MKKTFSVLFSFCIALICAQIKFEKGYIISSNDVKKEVFIKNQGWANNPDSFVYKTDEASSENTGTPSTIKEFGIYNEVKYVSYSGDIDYSSDNTGDLSSVKEPEFKKASLFLKQIATGNKNLYSYQGHNVIRYFYSDSEASAIQPLIYKKYFFNGNNLQVATNEEYIDQLKAIFSDDNAAQVIAPKTKYTSNDLKKIFSVYNSKFSGTDAEGNISETKRNTKFNLAVRPGLNFYSPLEITKTLSNEGAPSKTGFRIGVEAEIVLPFNRGKWSVVAEPTFSLYNNKTAVRTTNGNLYNINVENYSFISIPLSVRHYMFINDTSKIFINAGINLLTLKTSSAKDFPVDYDGYVFDRLKLSSSQAFKSALFGIGYNYKNKYIIEARYNTGMNLFEEKGAEANLKYASIILGYNIF
jgi:hypothetical protein